MPIATLAVPSLVHRVFLANGPEIWAGAVMNCVAHSAWNATETSLLFFKMRFQTAKMLGTLISNLPIIARCFV